MRRFHALAVSLLLTAAPAAAQEAVSDAAAPAAPSAAVETTTPAQAPVALEAPRHDKRLDVDRDQARQSMSAASQKQAPGPLAGHPWWWLVTAVAVGVVIAVIVAG
ncbi:MAG: hypothetical protein JWM27_322 [Gemmatimonadetes bacterium]|nr:hypothetical protein [Gemmatimonadota bacterium]